MRFSVFIVALCIAVLSGSCLKQDTYSCNYDACAVVAPAAEIQEVEAYLASAGIVGAVKHCSGMYYRILEPGTGSAPTNCSIVSAFYKGSLKNGTVFTDVTTTPDAFELSGVIKGWTNGLPLIKEGGKITLYIPPSLAYGATGGPPTIPANSMLVFDITLVATTR